MAQPGCTVFLLNPEGLLNCLVPKGCRVYNLAYDLKHASLQTRVPTERCLRPPNSTHKNKHSIDESLSS